MELSEFVSRTLVEINKGIKSAQDAEGIEGEINPPDVRGNNPKKERSNLTGEPIYMVDFDIAVTANEGTKTKGGIAVFGGFMGARTEGSSANENGVHNRIKFQVPITYPKLSKV
jgi:hypothetical protein